MRLVADEYNKTHLEAHDKEIVGGQIQDPPEDPVALNLAHVKGGVQRVAVRVADIPEPVL
jgi:hypothetical protein